MGLLHRFAGLVMAASSGLACAQGLPWAGDYAGELSLGTASLGGRLQLAADGRLAMAGDCPAGGDIVTPWSARGRAVAEDSGWLRLRLDDKTGSCALPKSVRVHPVAYQGRRFLFAERDLDSLVNDLNAYGIVNADLFLHGGPARDPARDGHFIRIGPDIRLPAPYAARILQAPVRGRIVRVGPVQTRQARTCRWMGPCQQIDEHTARLTIDLGTSDGVFPGMVLYPASGAARRLIVEQVLPHSAEASATWTGAPDLESGAAVSSRP